MDTLEVELDFAAHAAVDELEMQARKATFATFDIETGPLPEAELEPLIPFFNEPEPPGEFNPADVKLGNLKDEKKRMEKIEAERVKHAESILNYTATVAEKKAQHREKFIRDAALSPLTGRILAAGLLIKETFYIYTAENEKEEIELLHDYWGTLLEFNAHTLCGFNIERFDLPFLCQRSRLLGVKIPHFVRPRATGRYWSDLFIDLMKVWTFGGDKDFISLNTVARYLKCGQKSGDGADFATTFFGPDRQGAINYLKDDLSLTRRVGCRLGFK